MKRISAVSLTLVVCLLYFIPLAAEKDAAGCKDHPLIPRLEGYYIAGCDDHDGIGDFDIPKGETTQSVHVEGKSVAIMYVPQPDLKQKPTEAKLKAEFERAMTAQGATLAGTTPGQKWSVYRLLQGGKAYWFVLMIDSGQYFSGSYTVRLIEPRSDK